MIIIWRLFLLWVALLAPKTGSFIVKNRINNHQSRVIKLSMIEDAAGSIDLLKDFPLSTTIVSTVGSFGLWKLFNYWKIQFITAKTVSGIPKQSKVVELDVQDGKNVFYLSQGCDFTAVMKVTESDPVKRKEKNSFNERMILESIGKANSNKLNLQGKVRARTQEIPTRSVDCVLSVGALSRSSAVDETLQEVCRMLRPGGLFVFVEPDKIPFSSGGGAGSSDGDVVELVRRVFPEDIKVKSSSNTMMSSSSIKKSSVDNSLSSSNSSSDTSKKDSSKKNKKSSLSSTYKSRQAALLSDFESSVSTTAVTTDETETSNNVNNDSSKTTNDEGAFIFSSPTSENDSIPATTDESVASIKTSDDGNGAVLKPSSTWSSSTSKNSKPGLVFEVHNNILDTYVTGIAVRSY